MGKNSYRIAWESEINCLSKFGLSWEEFCRLTLASFLDFLWESDNRALRGAGEDGQRCYPKL